MKTPRVRVHGNSVYYHIRQLEDYRWHANEPSIVPPQKQLIEKFCTSKQDQPCTRGKKPAGIELRKYVFDSRTRGGGGTDSDGIKYIISKVEFNCEVSNISWLGVGTSLKYLFISM